MIATTAQTRTVTPINIPISPSSAPPGPAGIHPEAAVQLYGFLNTYQAKSTTDGKGVSSRRGFPFPGGYGISGLALKPEVLAARYHDPDPPAHHRRFPDRPRPAPLRDAGSRPGAPAPAQAPPEGGGVETAAVRAGTPPAATDRSGSPGSGTGRIRIPHLLPHRIHRSAIGPAVRACPHQLRPLTSSDSPDRHLALDGLILPGLRNGCAMPDCFALRIVRLRYSPAAPCVAGAESASSPIRAGGCCDGPLSNREIMG